MCLNALGIDPQKTWKGIWRWYTEDILKCASPETLKQGLNLEQFTLLAKCNGVHTTTFRPIVEKTDQSYSPRKIAK